MFANSTSFQVTPIPSPKIFFTAEKDLHSIVEWWISSCWGPHEDQVSRTSQPENVAIVPYVWHSLAIFYGEISLALT